MHGVQGFNLWGQLLRLFAIALLALLLLLLLLLALLGHLRRPLLPPGSRRCAPHAAESTLPAPEFTLAAPELCGN
jgi:hypothetical protein